MIKSGASKLDQVKITLMANGQYDDSENKYSIKQIAKHLSLTEKCVKSFMPKKK